MAMSLRSLTSSFGGSFWGRRGVGVMPDRGHHGEGEHDERDVTMPAVPGARFIVVEPRVRS